jgi:hypothetical protein
MFLIGYFTFYFINLVLMVTAFPPMEPFSSIVGNEQGDYVYAIANNCLYKSMNYGIDFLPPLCTGNIANLTSTINIDALYVDNSGQYVTLLIEYTHYYLYISEDYGQSFFPSLLSPLPSYIVNNNDRIFMMAANKDIFFSNDSGYSWSLLNNNLDILYIYPVSTSLFYGLNGIILYTVNITNSTLYVTNVRNFLMSIEDIHVNYNGQYLYVLCNTGTALYFYSSDNFGESFKNTSITGNIQNARVTCSNNGQYVYMSLYYLSDMYGNTAYIYSSINYGFDLKESTYVFNDNGNAVSTMSLNGDYYYFSNNGIYTSLSYGENFIVMGSDCFDQSDCNYFSTCNKIGNYSTLYGGYCEECPYPFATNVDSPDIINKNIYCTSINLRINNSFIYVILSIFFIFISAIIYVIKLNYKDIITFIVLPVSDVFITIMYILYVTFNNVYIFSFFLIFSFIPILHLIHIMKRKGLYPYFYLWHMEEETMTYIDNEYKRYMIRSDTPFLYLKLWYMLVYFFNLFRIFFLFSPRIIINSIIYIPLFFIGYILFSTKILFMKNVGDRYFLLFTGEMMNIENVENVDVGMYNESVIISLIISSIPKLIIQIVNSYMNKSITYITIVAVIITFIQFSCTLYTYSYYFFIKGKKMKDIPLNLTEMTSTDVAIDGSIDLNKEDLIKKIHELEEEIKRLKTVQA